MLRPVSHSLLRFITLSPIKIIAVDGGIVYNIHVYMEFGNVILRQLNHFHFYA